MNKKYIVRLSRKERQELNETVKSLKGSSQKARRSRILLKANINGPGWTEVEITDAFSCRMQTVYPKIKS
jgi:hypothetical protein